MNQPAWITSAAELLGIYALLMFAAVLAALLFSAWLVRRRLLPRLRMAAPQRAAALWMRLGLGFAFIIIAAMLFLGIADEIGAGEEIAQFDTALAQTLRQHYSPLARQLFGALTHFGDTVTLTGLCAIIAVLLVAFRRPWLAMGWVASVAGNSILNRTLKAVFERMRPLGDHGVALAPGWSFPSGHASGSLVTYGMLCYVLMRLLPPRWHLPLLLVTVGIVFSTGFSRVYLGYHYASDVLAGFASGAAWLTVCISALEFLGWYRGRRQAAFA